MEENNKDSRSLLMLLFPIGLLFLSLVILFGLGFRFYFKGNNNEVIPITAKDAVAVTTTVRDSLQKIYKATITELDSRLDSIWNNTDTIAGNLQVRLNEFYKLRKEITTLLKTGTTNADFSLASNKIGELQKKVEELSKRNQDVEDENKRLKDLLTQLNTKTKKNEPVTVVTTEENKPIPEKNTNTAINAANLNFTASDIKLAAVKIADEKEEETTDAEEAEKFVATFVVKNNYNEYNNTEVDLVVTQPDGQVLQPSAWESGTFTTREGKKIYSRKMRFDYLKGENKRLRLSLSAEKLQPGNYILQLYHNGTLIGRAAKQLS
ncbi:MAG: hypothetical protein HYX40_09505 [Sphingobacteriales bacterium]|nr:hypothetical protein [Sphingobacteriales bacterium]